MEANLRDSALREKLKIGLFKVDSLNINLSDKRTGHDSTSLTKRYDGRYVTDSGTGELHLTADSHTKRKGDGLISGKGFQFPYSVNTTKHGTIHTLKATAKAVEGEYFSGITLSNVHKIAELTNSNLGTSYTVEHILDARVTNLDICVDNFTSGYSNQAAFTQGLYNCFEPKDLRGNRDDSIIRSLQNEDNGFKHGTGYKVQRVRSRGALDILRCYDKALEIRTKSHEFMSSHFDGDVVNAIRKSNIYRMEYNVLTSKDMERLFKMKKVTVRDVLEVVESNPALLYDGLASTMQRYHRLEGFESVKVEEVEKKPVNRFNRVSKGALKIVKAMYQVGHIHPDKIVEWYVQSERPEDMTVSKRKELMRTVRQIETYLYELSTPKLIVREPEDINIGKDLMSPSEVKKRVEQMYKSFRLVG